MYCLHPVKIVNSCGEILTVSCRKCSHCLNVRRMKYTQDVYLMTGRYKYNLFIGLTYSNRYLPVFRFIEDSDGDGYHLEHVRPRDGLFADVPEYYEYPDLWTKEHVQDHFKLRYWHRTKYRPEHYGTTFDLSFLPPEDKVFGVLSRRDIVLFLKRLRNELVRQNHYRRFQCSTSFKYFFVGEYGPSKFRPHYHGIISTDDKEAFKRISKVVSKVWSYGRCTVERTYGTSGSGSYCASYVNGFGYVPLLQQLPAFRPFVLHSCHIGQTVDEDYYSDPRGNTFEHLNERVGVIRGKVKRLVPSVSVQSSLYPKCFRYGDSDIPVRLARLCLLYSLSRFLEEATGAEFTKVSEIVRFVGEYPEFLYARFPCRSGTYSLAFLYRGSRNVFTSIRTDLYRSKRFLLNCERFGMTVEEYASLLFDYYEARYKVLYGNWCMERQLRTSGVTSLGLSLEDCCSNYGNVLPSDWSGSCRNRDYYLSISMRRRAILSDFYGLTPEQVDASVSDITTRIDYAFCVYMADKIYNSNIKLKRQNDVNGVLFHG